MKYENPTCEIVLLNDMDCLTASDDTAVFTRDYDTPYVNYPNF